MTAAAKGRIHMKKQLIPRGSRILCLLLALLLLLPQAALAASHITVASRSFTARQGQDIQVPLDTIFRDGEGHALTYTVENNAGNEATTPISGGIYHFTSRAVGEYTPVIAASCGGDTVRATLAIAVEAAPQGDAAQYDYDETPAESVTVYVTISSDGVPILGADDDSTVLLRLPVTVPYFDLESYGLQDFYRYGTSGGQGNYTGTTVIERPTLLHLYIYLLERYYMNVPEDKCGKGSSGLLRYSEVTDVITLFGQTAYTGTENALNITGGSTSLYMKSFWGHDENLMYYRNHTYPLMSPGWGSTADYILLSDGDAIDLAMFFDWSFHQRGAFCRFDRDTYSTAKGKSFTVQTQQYGTRSVSDGGSETTETIDILNLSVYNAKLERVNADIVALGDGRYAVTLTQPGTYYLLAVDPYAGTDKACYAPAAACVEVEPPFTCDLNGDGATDMSDLQALFGQLCGEAPLTGGALSAADVNRDGAVDILDYQALYTRIVFG